MESEEEVLNRGRHNTLGVRHRRKVPFQEDITWEISTTQLHAKGTKAKDMFGSVRGSELPVSTLNGGWGCFTRAFG